MARRPNPATDFEVDVEGIGRFIFARRTLADETKIQVEFARITEGVTPTPWLGTLVDWQCTLSVLTVNSPPDWNVDEMDPLDDDTFSRLNAVYSALRAKELSFRRKPKQGGEGDRPANGQDNGVLVPPEVQSAAN